MLKLQKYKGAYIVVGLVARDGVGVHGVFAAAEGGRGALSSLWVVLTAPVMAYMGEGKGVIMCLYKSEVSFHKTEGDGEHYVFS